MRILNTTGCGVAIVPTTGDFDIWKKATLAQVQSKSQMVKRGNKFNLIMIELSFYEMENYRNKYENEIRAEKANLSESEVWTALAGKVGQELLAEKRIQLI